MPPLVSVVVLNWNGLKVVENCFNSLLQQDYTNMEIIMPDNGSTDGSVAFVKKNFPMVRIIENGKNLGFDEGNNVGYRAAKGKYVMLINNDTVSAKDLVSRLVSVLEKDDSVGIAHPAEYPIDASWSDDSKIRFTGIDFEFLGIIASDISRKGEQKYGPTGACFMVRKSIFPDLFDADYFAFCEEAYLGMRYWLSGHTIVFEPKAKFRHVLSHSSRFLREGGFHTEKNAIMNFVRFHSTRDLILLFPLLILAVVSKFIYLLLAFKFRILRERLASWKWTVVNWKLIMKKRRESQKERKIMSDKVFLHFLIESNCLPDPFFISILTRICRTYIKLLYPFL